MFKHSKGAIMEVAKEFQKFVEAEGSHWLLPITEVYRQLAYEDAFLYVATRMSPIVQLGLASSGIMDPGEEGNFVLSQPKVANTDHPRVAAMLAITARWLQGKGYDQYAVLVVDDGGHCFRCWMESLEDVRYQESWGEKYAKQ